MRLAALASLSRKSVQASDRPFTLSNIHSFLSSFHQDKGCEMKKLFRILPLALVIAAGSALADVPKNLKIGTDPTYTPFESKNASGELVGFDIDLAKELCKRIKAECTFVESDFDALIPSLKAKKIDAIIS